MDLMMGSGTSRSCLCTRPAQTGPIPLMSWNALQLICGTGDGQDKALSLSKYEEAKNAFTIYKLTFCRKAQIATCQTLQAVLLAANPPHSPE